MIVDCAVLNRVRNFFKSSSTSLLSTVNTKQSGSFASLVSILRLSQWLSANLWLLVLHGMRK